MAKLYAELTSDKGGRVVGKGGHESIRIQVKHANDYTYLFVKTDGIFIENQHGRIERIK